MANYIKILFVFLALSNLNSIAQVSNDSIAKSNQKMIDDLKFRINTIDNIGKTKSETELEIEALRLYAKKQEDSIAKLNVILKNYSIAFNSKPVGDGKYLNNSKLDNNRSKTIAVKSKSDVEFNASVKASGIYDELKNKCNCDLYFFIPYQTDLHYSEYAELQQIAKILMSNNTKTVKIIGHADKSGDEEKNIRLSKLRAQNLKSYFVDQLNIPASVITIEWKGSSSPVVSAADKDIQYLNRRIEVMVY